MKIFLSLFLCLTSAATFAKAPYPVPDTQQSSCYNATTEIACPKAGEPFAGQDAQHGV